AVDLVQARRLRAAAGELDEGAAGQAGHRHLGAGVALDRGAGLDAQQGADAARVVRRQAQALDRAYGDAVVLHGATLAKAGDRLVEDHQVFLPAALGRPVGAPQGEQQQGDADQDREGADQDVVGLGFHQQLASAVCPGAPVALAARARGPWKYSRTQGWSSRSISGSGAQAITRLSASTATRSQIA